MRPGTHSAFLHAGGPAPVDFTHKIGEDTSVDTHPNPARGPSRRGALRRQIFWSWLFNFLLFLGFGIIAFNADWFTARVRLYRETSLFAHWWTLVLSMALLLFSAALVHELGHLAAGWAARLRFQTLLVGPLRIWRAGERLHVGLVRNFVLTRGMVASSPRSRNRLPQRLLLFTVGGPLASLLLFGAAMWLFWQIKDSRAVWQQAAWLVESAFMLALITAYFTIGSLRPVATPDGPPADGERIAQLLRGGPEADRWCALFVLQGANLEGVRPRAWDARLVRQALAIPDGSHDDLQASVTAYQWALDQGRCRLAARYLDEVMETHRMWRVGGRDRFALEKAYVLARCAGDPGAARRWMEKVGQPRAAALLLRARAAVLLAEGRTQTAATQARSAISLLSKETSGTAVAERAWLEEIIIEAGETAVSPT